MLRIRYCEKCKIYTLQLYCPFCKSKTIEKGKKYINVEKFKKVWKGS